jgi:heptosyltransferase-2
MPQQIVVIRFGALGDLCLAGWSLARLAAAPGRDRRRVTLVTKARFADLAGRFTGVDAVLPLAEPGRTADLVRLAAGIRALAPDVVVDAHGVLRSRLLDVLLGRRPHARLRKDTAARLRLLRGRPATAALDRHLRARLDDTFDRAGLLAPDAGTPVAAPLAHLAAGFAGTHLAERAGTHPRPPVLGLAPGAQWDPKRWPQEHWVALLELARQAQPDLAIRVFLGPREASWFDGSPLDRALGALGPGVEIIRDRPLTEVARQLAGCRVLVCNDSGLLHLAEAVGTPVVALFGPTVRAFGYAPSLGGSTLLETLGLECRPCSRNGKRPCHRGDLACLVRIEPQTVWRAAAAHGPWT